MFCGMFLFGSRWADGRILGCWGSWGENEGVLGAECRRAGIGRWKDRWGGSSRLKDWGLDWLGWQGLEAQILLELRCFDGL